MNKAIFMALVATLVPILFIPAHAAQLDVNIPADATEITPSYKFLRVINLEYLDGGKLADILQGKNNTISFSADSKTLGVSELISKLNTQLENSLSSARVNDVKINYQAILDVSEKSTTIEYKIEIIPTITNHVVTINSQRYIDSDWRGFKLDGPVLIEIQYGDYDINNPESVLRVLVPELLQEIENTDAKQILNFELLDASGISDLPLYKWDFLFDPTGILVEAQKVGFKENSVISYYSMGTCNIIVGPCSDESVSLEFMLDEKYTIRTIESQDDATISMEGYATLRTIGESEVFAVSESPVTIGPIQEFPVGIIYGMAIMAAVGGGLIFIISNRKLKAEQGQTEQTGIDPALLRAYPTHAVAGGYQTVRGEAHLVSDADYQKTRSVYDENSEPKSSTRGSLPKGWE